MPLMEHGSGEWYQKPFWRQLRSLEQVGATQRGGLSLGGDFVKERKGGEGEI